MGTCATGSRCCCTLDVATFGESVSDGVQYHGLALGRGTEAGVGEGGQDGHSLGKPGGRRRGKERCEQAVLGQHATGRVTDDGVVLCD